MEGTQDSEMEGGSEGSTGGMGIGGYGFVLIFVAAVEFTGINSIRGSGFNRFVFHDHL